MAVGVQWRAWRTRHSLWWASGIACMRHPISERWEVAHTHSLIQIVSDIFFFSFCFVLSTPQWIFLLHFLSSGPVKAGIVPSVCSEEWNNKAPSIVHAHFLLSALSMSRAFNSFFPIPKRICHHFRLLEQTRSSVFLLLHNFIFSTSFFHPENGDLCDKGITLDYVTIYSTMRDGEDRLEITMANIYKIVDSDECGGGSLLFTLFFYSLIMRIWICA